MKTTKKRTAKKVTSRKPAANEPTSNSQFAGKKLYPSKEAAKANPRREGSHGFRSLAIIIAKPGISYSDFLAAGGRNRDLRYDVSQGHAVARA
jgi:hypothetical protein